ncbi:MAG: galactokinase family protein [Spirochaetota bacterium]
MGSLEDVIQGEELYRRLFGGNTRIIEYKKQLLGKVWRLFKHRFSSSARIDRVALIHVPNRVELLGKHTDYQGGETFLLTGPKNFFALAAPSSDGVTEMVNAHRFLGETVLRLGKEEPEILEQGVGSNYTAAAVKRLCTNLNDSGFPPLENIKAVFVGDIPFGGGTSGSSAKLIADFLCFASVNGLLENDEFVSLVLKNGRKAGIKMGQQRIDDFLLCLSMYLAHFENGLNFGGLRGEGGVGTFGGSEDHTAIFLGKQHTLLYCRYCPTELLESVEVWKDYRTVVAYSGKKAEKTSSAMEKYNRLSLYAAAAVRALNEINSSHHWLLREFFPDLTLEEKARKAYRQILKAGKGDEIARRAYQFFKERGIMEQAVSRVRQGDIRSYGELINASHMLSRDYLGNIAPEVDFLQAKAVELGACGATGFGAGFGGSCYCVVPKDEVRSFIPRWQKEYLERFPRYKEAVQFDVYPACRGCYWEVPGG